MFWDTSEPYYYLRIQPHGEGDYAIFGGKDHKTGQEINLDERYRRLEELLLSVLPGAELADRWSGQVIEAHDGLPYIGETAEHQFVATGFAGNGMTFGTLAAMMARDAVAGRKNPWSELFRPDRKKIFGGAWDYIKENIDYPYYMAKDRLRGAEGNSLDDVGAGEAKILRLDGDWVAAHRDRHGEAHACSAVCTHMGCIVHWNSAEATWDCPCHGSRFTPDGELLAGPAESPLATVDIHEHAR
jgi:Rieske Fe-S protein